MVSEDDSSAILVSRARNTLPSTLPAAGFPSIALMGYPLASLIVSLSLSLFCVGGGSYQGDLPCHASFDTYSKHQMACRSTPFSDKDICALNPIGVGSSSLNKVNVVTKQESSSKFFASLLTFPLTRRTDPTCQLGLKLGLTYSPSNAKRSRSGAAILGQKDR